MKNNTNNRSRSFDSKKSKNSNNFGGSRFGGLNRSGPRNFNNGPKEMHKAVCADCKTECDVPFKPTGERPVYCRDCFAKHKSPGRF